MILTHLFFTVARILLSWFPGLQGNALVRPVIAVCDPYLNLFRQVIPPIFGLDLSPVIALFVLQAFGSVSFLAEKNDLTLLFRNLLLLTTSINLLVL